MRGSTLPGPNQRRGKRDRRSAFWVQMALVAVVFYLAGGGTGIAIAGGIPADALAASDSAQTEALEALQGPILQELAAIRDSARNRVIEVEVPVPYPVVETVYKDTLYLPGPAPEPQIVEVPGPPIIDSIPVIRLVEVPTPQPAGVCFDPHSFTSSHTFRPSVGTGSWFVAGLTLGLLMTIQATAEAEVYVNE